MSPRKPAKAENPENPEEIVRYADLLAELERILEDLESDAIDVDELGARVRRASELIRICRERLTRSRAEIEQVVADLDSLDATATDAAVEEDDDFESDESPF